jgi:NAD-dependent dihydropyrimidine dehydrogenase PreA subunit
MVMTKRKIILIDEERCTGCGLCLPNCPEGALQIIDGKARLISDLFCDGLGACIGHCPEGAITIEERTAKPYDERKVMDNIIQAGNATILAHLHHLQDHGEHSYLKEALAVLKEKHIDIPSQEHSSNHTHHAACNCPGAAMQEFIRETRTACDDETPRLSHLTHWPVQLHLISPTAPYYHHRDVLLTADCVGYAFGDFHAQYLKGKSITIACPKLDSNLDSYQEKMVSLIDDAQINTLTVMTMEVPCCQELLQFARLAAAQSKRKIPIKSIVIGIKGAVLKEEWIHQ